MARIRIKSFFTRNNIRYRIIRAYLFSMGLMFLIWLLGRIVTLEFIDEIKHDNRLYYHVTHQLTHTAGIKEQVRKLTDKDTLTKTEIRQCYNDYVYAFRRNHQLILDCYKEEKAYFEAGMEKYVYLSLPNADTLYQKINTNLVRFEGLTRWEIAESKEIIEQIRHYEVELHTIVHGYFEEIEDDFFILNFWINIILSSLVFTVAIVIMLYVVKPAFLRLGQYMLENLQTQRKIKHINLRLEKTNQAMKLTQKLLEIEQKQSMKMLNAKLELIIQQEKTEALYLVQGQEEERKRVARELHDSIGQMLTGIKYGLDKWKTKLIDKKNIKPAEVDNLLKLTSQTIEETRRILMGLLPSTLETFGILGALKSLIDDLQLQHPQVQFQFIQLEELTHPLSNSVALGIFRIVQESLHNALKHANPSEILVELESEQRYINVRVIDNGIGFDLDQLKNSDQKKLGIENMRKRCKLLEGYFYLESIVDQGTEVRIMIPV